jgi:hypothetical protein
MQRGQGSLHRERRVLKTDKSLRICCESRQNG